MTDEEYPYEIFCNKQDATFFLRRKRLEKLYYPMFVSKQQMEWFNDGKADIHPTVPLTKYNMYYCVSFKVRKFLLKNPNEMIRQKINNEINGE